MTAKSVVEEEYERFASDATSDIVWLDGNSKRMQLLVSGENVTVHVPDGYPTPEDGNFFVESDAGRLSSWVSSVNEYIQGQPSTLSLKSMLGYAVSALKKSAASSSSSSDDDSGSEGGGGSEDVVEMSEDEPEEGGSDHLAKELELLKMKKRWAKKEEELRAKKQHEEEEERKSLRHLTQTEKERKKAEVNQIFSSDSASRILQTELLAIMESKMSLGFSAEPVDDNIYRWNVRYFDFPVDCPLAHDLREIKARYGYQYVELEVAFVLDLYPFYPPVVSLVRPRFQVFMMNKVTSMDCLKLSKWDPVKDMRSVLGDIKMMLQELGRLDVDHPMNDNTRFAEGAYTRLEHYLLRLEIVSETEPRAEKLYEDKLAKFAVPTRAVPVFKKDTDESDEPARKKLKTEYWKKGTGYGHSGAANEWDPQAYMAAQEEKDNQVVKVLRDITEYLHSPDMDGRHYQTLEESALIPYIEMVLRNDSLLDMSRHPRLIQGVLSCLTAMSRHPLLVPLLDRLPKQTESLVQRLAKMNKMSTQFLSLTGSIETASSDGVIARSFVAVYQECSKAVHAYRESRGPPAGMEEPAARAAAESAGGKEASVDAVYCDTLRRLQYGEMHIPFDGPRKHHYPSDSASLRSHEKVLKLAQEQSSLATSLPLNFSSSVFLRVDGDRMDFMQALITGPEDTPYESGCFRFDVKFPDEYPNGPPKVNLDTTGGGSIRFNPNLYNCGKVCLSLLGTWQGARGEDWNKDTSTFLQVLVSIQSLILVPEPYFNEPGYERSMGTPEGTARSNEYNEVIRVGTVQFAMVDQLRDPAPGFEDVIRTHFFLKRERILTVLDRWLAEARSSGRSAHERALKTQVDALRPLLAALTLPDLSRYADEDA